MTKKFQYKTTLIKGTSNGIFAEFPFESAKEFGTRRTVRVKATFDGVTFDMSLLPHGNGTHWLHVKKEIRETIGKEEGDTVSISVQEVKNLPTIELPEHLLWLLENEPDLHDEFNALTWAQKKMWKEFTEEPKSDEAKVERINHFFDFLRKKHSGKTGI
ncbi:protein of unknown function [Mariniphaga anaerophila]|uniref:Bacteriocin-protection, YdeI or OmpD-Associated n=1 Tax=Mariniphaga anaerophila TaxID=1484053 RepID=A0A1M4YN54_9BACT|nr:YdeI/OmpD-associated family protein [Mariniphaga anaerophila]SHF07067.1 protein of unknown function [Mariniphaga anaerophila]